MSWKKFKILVWKLVPSWQSCPLCGSDMEKYGYPEQARYYCKNKKCEWNREVSK